MINNSAVPKFLKKNSIYIIVFILASIISIGLMKYESGAYDTKTLYGNTETTVPFTISKDMVLTQDFQAENLVGGGINLEAIENIDEVPNVDVEIKLIDRDTNNEISSLIFNTMQNGVGAKQLYVKDKVVYKEGIGNYRMTLRQISDSTDGKTIAVLTEQQPLPNDVNMMTIDQTNQSARLSVTAMENANVNFIWLITTLMIVTSLSTAYMIKEKKAKEKIFVVLFLGFGIIYSLLMSPFVIPDEATHYDRAYSLSNIFTGNEQTMRREEDLKLFTYLHTPNKNTVQETFDNLISLSSSNEMVEGNVIHSQLTTTIPYVAPALGMTVGKILNLGAYPMFYLGRLCNLLLMTLLIYLAIKFTPVGKTVLLVIALFPMTLHLAGSYSYDSIVIGSTMLFVAYILYLKYDKKKIELKDYTLLLIMATMFLSAKSFGYMAFLLLLIILPWKSFNKKDKQKFGLFISALALITLYTTGVISIVKDIVFPTRTAIESNSTDISYYSYVDVIKSPFKFIIMVFSTLYRNIEMYIKGMVGDNLCWFTFPVKELFIYMHLLLMLFSGLNKENEFKFNIKDRRLIAFVAVITCGLVTLSMAIAYTPATMNSILGVQGRYFIPVIFVLIISVYNLSLRLDRNITNVLMYGVLFVQLLTVMDIALNILRI